MKNYKIFLIMCLALSGCEKALVPKFNSGDCTLPSVMESWENPLFKTKKIISVGKEKYQFKYVSEYLPNRVITSDNYIKWFDTDTVKADCIKELQ